VPVGQLRTQRFWSIHGLVGVRLTSHPTGLLFETELGGGAVTVRQMSAPAVSPRAKAASPIATMPRSSNTPGVNRFMLTRWRGLDREVIMRLHSPATAMPASPSSATLTASQRVRMTLCVQARPVGAGLEFAGDQHDKFARQLGRGADRHRWRQVGDLEADDLTTDSGSIKMILLLLAAL